MPVERRGPAVCNGSNNKGGKGEMRKAPISLQDLRRSLYIKAKAETSWRFWGLYVHICKMEIPKDGGKVRILSISAIRDRVVQGALKLILEPIFEADFQTGSYGYRPN